MLKCFKADNPEFWFNWNVLGRKKEIVFWMGPATMGYLRKTKTLLFRSWFFFFEKCVFVVFRSSLLSLKWVCCCFKKPFCPIILCFNNFYAITYLLMDDFIFLSLSNMLIYTMTFDTENCVMFFIRRQSQLLLCARNMMTAVYEMHHKAVWYHH